MMKERLIEIRKYFDMSQREFCHRLGMTQSTYAPLETGKREIRDAYVKLICKAYEVNEDWFKNGIGEMFIGEPNKELDELLNVYDNLTPSLKTFLLKQAKDLKDLQQELNEK